MKQWYAQYVFLYSYDIKTSNKKQQHIMACFEMFPYRKCVRVRLTTTLSSVCFLLHLRHDVFLFVTKIMLLWTSANQLALQLRHNERDGVSNHQPHECLVNRLFRRRSAKHRSSASLAFVRGIHRWPVNSPHKGPVTRKMFPFDDVIMFFFTSDRCMCWPIPCKHILTNILCLYNGGNETVIADVIHFTFALIHL